jgi:hypothetical protein
MSSLSAIDRAALVARHRIHLTTAERWLQVGNGEFTANLDASGLQTCAGNLMAHWAWHAFPLPAGCSAADIPATGSFDRGHPRGYQQVPPGREALYAWMYENPHRLGLGRLGLVRADGRRLAEAEFAGLDRQLDLWSGLATSAYAVDGEPMRVEACCHPHLDLLAARLSSPALGGGALRVALDFAYPLADRGEPFLGDWEHPDRHATVAVECSARRVVLRRTINGTTYLAIFEVAGGTIAAGTQPHTWLATADGPELEVLCWFGAEARALPGYAVVRAASQRHWEGFWRSGGAIDLSHSRDPRWRELERRIVLSQYVMAVQSAGSMPPQETGLRHNSWNGQSHLEMLWWHSTHYALWDRWHLAEGMMDYYRRIAPVAAQLAAQLGMSGLKWPKMVGPEGRNAPSPMHLALLWQQPHPIFFAELEHRRRPGHATLEYWRDIVLGTAEHMADYAQAGTAGGLCALDPAIPCCEQGISRNTVFELAYWRHGLELAQTWRERLGLGRDPRFDAVIHGLPPLPERDGVYLIAADWADTWEGRRKDHPDPIGPFAFLPLGRGVDPVTAHRTLLRTWQEWNWSSCWGWDFPWLAMAAARVGEPGIAIEALLHPAPFNQYTACGINAGWYQPGNGGILYAVAMMAAGWDGAPDRPAPGFPADGTWTVRHEGLQQAP